MIAPSAKFTECPRIIKKIIRSRDSSRRAEILTYRYTDTHIVIVTVAHLCTVTPTMSRTDSCSADRSKYRRPTARSLNEDERLSGNAARAGDVRASRYPGDRAPFSSTNHALVPISLRRHSSISRTMYIHMYRHKTRGNPDGSTVIFDTKVTRRSRIVPWKRRSAIARYLIGVVVFPRRRLRRKESSLSPFPSGAHSPYVVARWQPFLISLDNSLSGA